jgi:hypothetical protein
MRSFSRSAEESCQSSFARQPIWQVPSIERSLACAERAMRTLDPVRCHAASAAQGQASLIIGDEHPVLHVPGPGRPSQQVAPAIELAVIELGALGPTVLQAGRLLIETIVVPTLLLAVLLHTSGIVAGASAAIGWCLLTVVLRWCFGRRLPASLLLGTAVVAERAAVALATSSAFVYLLQPALGSVVMSLLFIGSAAIGRPVTLRLARDVIALPDDIVDRHDVRRMFTQVALLWGLSRLIDAAMSIGSLQLGVGAGLLSRGVLSPTLTVIAIGVCALWGIRSLRRCGITVRMA